ncbi:MAG: HPr family phosphocarrier protein [Thermodesulfobacteriota bacterium]
MDNSTPSLEKTVSIVNDLGLHARAAARLAKAASRAGGPVWLVSGGQKVDATSVIDILTLACCKGTTVTLQVDSPADIDVLNELEALVKSGFGE